MAQPDELKVCLLCILTKTPEKHSCKSVSDAVKKHKEYLNTRTTPDLSRILKLAAAAREYAKASNGRTLQDAYDEETALMDIETASEALTPEDHQLLEAVLKE